MTLKGMILVAKKLQAIRGMNDILPNQISYWQYLEDNLRAITASYGYTEMRFPVVEQTQLFSRTIGEVTDIVEKEMYTFEDRNGDSLSLRPEGTAGCVRAGIEHGLLYNQQQRLWYMGPMFRHERPQKGRYRQFFQFGIEAFGMEGPDIDAEQIMMMARLWRKLGIHEQVRLEINSLGNLKCRDAYREKLVEYFSKYESQLDDESKRRLKDKSEAVAYLQVALDEYQEDGDTAAFMIALRHVTKAHGGVAKLAESTNLSRESLYRTLSDKGNPRLRTLGKILHALGFHILIEAI